MILAAEPLNPLNFAPFGDVLAPPSSGRSYFDDGLCNARETARGSLSMIRALPLEKLPMQATVLVD